ncbi:carbonic anhydrase [Streptomyces virginiae]|uniref:carbonic anhydrase n=1 Tax=Streptomyces virginiae TaxID=1961 RepID=UPI00224F46CE|nr:carbonic anhydrase [Streptomyces virginiae]MCX5275317.1 carbonic anhydrase [Streptomyces virginiae]
MSGPFDQPALAVLVEGSRTYRDRAAAAGIRLGVLGNGQRPKVMLIACSDARLVPSLITTSRPGEVLELRTHGGVIPRFEPEPHTGEALTIEYAVSTLQVTDIVVLGHSHCEVVDVDVADRIADGPEPTTWSTGDFTAAGHAHVLRQLDILSDYACIAPRLADETLRLHGWYHELESGSTLSYRPHVSTFLPL